ncbi:MAG: transcription-repair coupling factor [Pedosphaera sp. Tous-C6FEB]|nr:MAG: transcription-repair coupling factor [Pedosphaera sp. Tous-C6FEB]
MEYAEQVPDGSPFFADWEELRGELLRRKMTVVALMEDEVLEVEGPDGEFALCDQLAADARPLTPALSPGGGEGEDTSHPAPNSQLPLLSSLEAFRPIAERMPTQEVALAQRREFFLQLQRWLRSGFAVHVVCNNDGEAQRFGEIWQELGGTSDNRQAVRPALQLGALARGFLCEVAKFVVVTDAEVFGRYKVQRPRRMKSAHAIAARSALDIDFSELEEGDYVVHLQHGIGRFKGLKLLPTNKPGRERYHLEAEQLRARDSASAQGAALPHPGPLPLGEGANAAGLDAAPDARGSQGPAASPTRSNLLPLPAGEGRGEGEQPPQLRTAPTPPRTVEGIECLVLEYAPSDTDREPPKLYVPVTEAHLISKYVGAGKMRPPLNTLGGKRWEKTKQQAERAVRDVAADLLKIQAQRATQPGHAFGPDTPWQREFESSFLFEETADQLRAIAEAKRDLEIPKPMDRLVCGDVGFGKTEVAIRAAFKAVMGGKQVALLVPTTVLAQQHYNTFRERMADYPVRVELLSRFRTRKEQLKVVEQLAAGAVDIVIGTHRLVQSDVTFKDLGLVIIDEEQRFGVLHKEKFKLMRTHVDVLTLSATPIPRTLYLALTGARDMSTIQTPPQDRLPVETIVEHYDDRVIRDAIRRELERGGQVFFLHNRVTTIEAMRSKLQLLLPNARIVVGHGQMSGDELEDVMTKFVNGEADVLLSTTIIESGLDIPNANTIIIDRADRFGLSQLYQLRGRVGRYKHQAFAYLLLPRHARLLTDVRKRMSAIKQYAQLGSGFKIAMRDLEIRGAGNLLGAQQSGHITAVGFELYCNLLKQSVATLKGEKVKQRTNAALRLDFLKLHAVEERGGEDRGERIEDRLAKQERAARTQPSISVPREGGVWVQESRPERVEEVVEVKKGGAFLPPAYITEPQHRIEAYRKLAQAETKADVDALARELKDRYGPPPRPVELLLLATELKLLAGERGLDAIETKAGKLMLHRRGDYIQLGGKFPRLMKTEPVAVLKEIKKLLLSL